MTHAGAPWTGHHPPEYRKPTPEQNAYDLAQIRQTLFGPVGTNGIYGDMRTIKSDIAEIRDHLRIIQDSQEMRDIERRLMIIESRIAEDDAKATHRWDNALDQIQRWTIKGALTVGVFLVGYYINQEVINRPIPTMPLSHISKPSQP